MWRCFIIDVPLVIRILTPNSIQNKRTFLSPSVATVDNAQTITGLLSSSHLMLIFSLLFNTTNTPCLDFRPYQWHCLGHHKYCSKWRLCHITTCMFIMADCPASFKSAKARQSKYAQHATSTVYFNSTSSQDRWWARYGFHTRERALHTITPSIDSICCHNLFAPVSTGAWTTPVECQLKLSLLKVIATGASTKPPSVLRNLTTVIALFAELDLPGPHVIHSWHNRPNIR